jgi:hypothetical protein
VLDRKGLSLVADTVGVAGPEQPQHVDRHVGATATAREVHTDRGRLAGQRTESDGEQPHAPLGQHVDGGQPLREDDRVVVW